MLLIVLISKDVVTGFDLNLPVDEFGAVDSHYLQNLADMYPHLQYFLHFSLKIEHVADN